MTLSSGASSCAVTVPTATPSCALSFGALGARTVSAAYTPANGNHAASSSSGPGNAQTLVYAQSDLAVTKNDGVMQYAIAVRDAAGELRLADWHSYTSEPSLDWTARPQSGGWMLESAEIG